jgi:hypothetical protein
MIRREFKSKIFSNLAIVDTEICNDITNPKGGDWLYENSDIITVGILQGNDITIIQREKADKIEDYISAIKKIIPERFYAFNWKMEKFGLKGFTKKEYHVEEIKPFMGKGFNKIRFFEELKSIISPMDELKDPLNDDSSLVQTKYEQEKYEEIIQHNLNCVVKEAYILKFKPALIKKFKDKLDSKGWYQNDKK